MYECMIIMHSILVIQYSTMSSIKNNYACILGEFGIVYLAEVMLPQSDEKQTVAVKTIKGRYLVYVKYQQ